jgi:hypothetical protein
MQYDGTSGAIQRWFAYGQGSNDVLSLMNVAAATRTTFIPDIQGSVIASIDSASGAVSKVGYLPYGKSVGAGPYPEAWRDCDFALPEARFDFTLAMCQKSNVKNMSILVRMLLIVGLIVSPLSPPVFAATAQSVTMSAALMNSDDMSSRADPDNAALPCHDGKMDCDKPCPCMAACVSLSIQCLPSIASIVARIVVVGQRLALSSDVQLASLTAPPPARPPRA